MQADVVSGWRLVRYRDDAGQIGANFESLGQLTHAGLCTWRVESPTYFFSTLSIKGSV